MLKSLLEQQLYEKLGSDTKSLSLLPNDVIVSIRKNIRKGAEDIEQKWANALELVHKAYDVDGVQRPEPNMKDAWKQYEENLQYAVQQLSTNRGADGDWRMSSSMFREALVPTKHFRVKINDDEFITEGTHVSEVIDGLTESVPGYNARVKQTNGTHQIQFSRFNVRNNTTVSIQEIS